MVSLLLGISEILSSEQRVRRVSESGDESRRRGHFRRTLILTDSLAPSSIGLIRIEEAWIEVAKRTRLGTFPRETGRELLVLRIDSTSSDAYFLVRGLDWPKDTIIVQSQFRGGPRVRFASRESRFPDTVRFVEPPKRRGRTGENLAMLTRRFR